MLGGLPCCCSGIKHADDTVSWDGVRNERVVKAECSVALGGGGRVGGGGGRHHETKINPWKV